MKACLVIRHENFEFSPGQAISQVKFMVLQLFDMAKESAEGRKRTLLTAVETTNNLLSLQGMGDIGPNL